MNKETNDAIGLTKPTDEERLQNALEALEEIRLEEEESQRIIEEIAREMLELFSPCPDCNLAKDCISYSKQKPPKNRHSRRRYFKKWIEKCVKNSKVKSRQEILYLADAWPSYHLKFKRYIDYLNRPSYRYTVNECLREIIDERQYGIHREDRKRVSFFYSNRLGKEIKDIIQKKFEFTKKLRCYSNEIGDCLTNIVAEYFDQVGEGVKIKVPIESSKNNQASGEMDIDVLTDKYVIEIRNRRQPLNIDDLNEVLKRYEKWEEKGYNRKKMLICCKTWGNRMIEKCKSENIILIPIGFQVIPEKFLKEVYEGIDMPSLHMSRTGIASIKAGDAVKRHLVWERLRQAFA